MKYFNFGETTYENLPPIFWKKQHPYQFENPQLVIFNYKLADELGISKELANNPHILTGGGEKDGTSRQLLTMAYAGYQFGNFVMLGDGRAALLGEHIVPGFDNHTSRYDIQLKGSGRTPFSRGGDGFAAIMPMLREYLISEYLYAVGIPTSRSLAVATTGKVVYREKMLKGAVLTRVAKSHLRVGTFDYAITHGELTDLKSLSNYAISRHYPQLDNIDNKSERYLTFFKEIVKVQAELIAKWQQIGFVHGVMNTDNMSISGESIDFGPCAFLDFYNPNAVFSSIDRQGRYAYKNQVGIAIWNLTRLAEALLPLFDNNQEKALLLAKEQLSGFSKIYSDIWLNDMCYKLGLDKHDPINLDLVKDFLSIMEKNQLDYTNTFLEIENREGKIFEIKSETIDFLKKQILNQGSKTRINPFVIPRNQLVEEALQYANQGDITKFNELLEVLQNPYIEPKNKKYMNQPPKEYKCVTFCGT